ncbi:DNA-binding HxlR family transcriptional regulator [Oxalobacteraceae bacterium GrIS 1.11]
MEHRWHIDNPLACPLVQALNLIGGKWKPIVLHMLSERTLRFGELKSQIPPVSQKVLTSQLRELEADDMIVRTVYAEVPPKVEYKLSVRGASLVPLLNALYAWGQSSGASH